MAFEDAAENLENLSRVTDVLTRAATLANANTEQFSEALTEKAGVALRNLNKDVEEGAAALAVFADQGVKGGQAGTTLNASLEGLSRQAIINKDIFAEYNVEVFDTEGNMKHLADITEDLEKSLGGMSVEEQRATLMKMGFNRQALNGIQMLMGNSEAIRGYEKELRSAGGVTQEVAEKQMNNLWDQLGLVKDRLIDSGIVLGEVLGNTIRDVVIPMIDRLVESIAKIAEWFANLDPQWQQFIITALAIAAALGPVILIAGKIATAIGVLIPIISKIIAVVKIVGAAIAGAASGPLLLIVGAIAAVIAIGILLYKNWDKIKEVLDRVWGAIVDFFTVTIPKAIDIGLQWFRELPGKVVGFLNELPGKIGELLGKVLGHIIKFGIDAVRWAIDEVPKFIGNIIKFYKELPGKIWEWLLAALKKLGEWAVEGLRIVGSWGKDLLAWAKKELPGIVNNVIGFFKSLPGKLFDIGKDLVQGLWDGIKSMGKWISDKVSDFVGGIVSGVKGVLGISSPSRIFMGIGENITTGLARGISGAQAVVDSAMTRLFDPSISLNYTSGSVGVSDTDATAQAVYRAMMDAIRLTQASSSASNRDVVIKINNRELAREQLPELIREAQRQGFDLIMRPQGV
jgi:TP901 family phage tail tape measure protein